MFTINNLIYKNILNIKSLSIPSNKVTCILGESGCGKTTLLRLLNKLISYDSGEILFNGESIDKIDSIDLRRKVVMLSQNPATFKGNIKDNLLVGLKFSEKPLLSDNELLETLIMVHLNKSLEDSVENLSGGEKQRLALGRVLLLDPECFLLDEPSSALDEETEHIIIEKIVEYAKENNKTLIMVTHSKKVAENFADCIFQFKNGRVADSEEV